MVVLGLSFGDAVASNLNSMPTIDNLKWSNKEKVPRPDSPNILQGWSSGELGAVG